uniref:Mavicyanin n=1 Tax=Aegilops tauschii TaxID=37682 RepID=N1R5D0_AEGTA
MASKQMIVAVFAVAFLPVLAVATEHMVGDDKGWTLNFNYTAWAETNQFVVGDTLVFKYGSPAHNLVEVGGADFVACTQTAGAVVRTSGKDRLALDTAGRRWFFCGVGPHCKSGMKRWPAARGHRARRGHARALGSHKTTFYILLLYEAL